MSSSLKDSASHMNEIFVKDILKDIKALKYQDLEFQSKNIFKKH